MNPLHWGAEFWALVLMIGAIVGVREGLKRWQHRRDGR